MDIQPTSRRPNAEGASLATDAKSPGAASAAHAEPIALATATDSAPATIQALSKGGLFLGLMAVLESKHPDEAKLLLLQIADELHAEAKHDGSPAQGLALLADKFRIAAQTGNLASLLPSERPPAHFGIRAYQLAEQLTADPSELGAMFGLSASGLLKSSTLAALNNEMNAATLAHTLLDSEIVSRANQPAGSTDLADGPDPTTLAWLQPRRDELAARRLRWRRSQPRRKRRRWRRKLG